MFPPELEHEIDRITTPFNERIASGLATHELKKSATYIDKVLKSVARGFPSSVRYAGYRPLTPEEEFAKLTSMRAQAPATLDIANSTLRMFLYMFEFHQSDGQIHKIDKPLQLLHGSIGGAGRFEIAGSKFLASPVLADQVFSVMEDHVFIKLMKAKLIVKQLSYHWMAAGIRDSAYVAWADVYNERSTPGAPRNPITAKTCLAHYLFCKFGVTKAFRKFAHAEIKVGGIEITEQMYPPDKWLICTSVQIKPKTYRLFYEPSDIRVAVRIDQLNTMTRCLLAGLFYVVDHFPQRMLAREIDNIDTWRVMLGLLIWSGTVNEGKLLSNVNNHFNSLDEYVDNMVIDKLRVINVPCQDVYELFGYVISNMIKWLQESSRTSNSMWNKELVVLPFIYYKVIEAIHLLYFKLNASQHRELTLQRVEKALQHLTPGVIYKVTRNGEVSTTSCPGDNPATRMTSIIVPQAKSASGTSADRTSTTDPSQRLHPSTIDTGCYLALPKADPSGRGRINLAVQTTDTGLIVRDPRYIDILNEAEQYFSRR